MNSPDLRATMTWEGPVGAPGLAMLSHSMLTALQLLGEQLTSTRAKQHSQSCRVNVTSGCLRQPHGGTAKSGHSHPRTLGSVHIHGPRHPGVALVMGMTFSILPGP